MSIFSESFNENEETASRRYYIYSDGKTLEVSREIYTAYYQPVWRTWKRAHSLGECALPGNCWWQCADDCLSCPHFAGGFCASLDEIMEEDMYSCMSGTCASAEKTVLEAMSIESIIAEIAEAVPNGAEICAMRIGGYGWEEISSAIDTPISTMRSQLKKIRKNL